jgi:hypothetical protein
MGRLGGEIILLNCCKRLQISRTFFQVVAVLAEGKSCCLYRTFVTWKLGAGLPPPHIAEGLPTRWRPLYDHYGPVRPGLLRRSAVPAPEPPTTPAIVRLPFSFQLSAFLLSPARPVVRGRVVPLSHCPISASRHGPQSFMPFGITLGPLLGSANSQTPACNQSSSTNKLKQIA